MKRAVEDCPLVLIIKEGASCRGRSGADYSVPFFRYMKVKSGKIPEEVIYFAGSEREVTFKWDDVEDLGTVVGKVRPAYVSDASNKQTCQTGKEWIARHKKYYDNAKKAYVESNDVKEEKMDNDPFSIQIINLEFRGNGGRAYKVVTEHGYYVDLREDVLLDVIKQSNIDHGEPGCQFIWGKVGAEMKLVRTGSALHEALLVATEVGSTKVIKSRDLVPGQIYQSKGGEIQVFIGWVDYDLVKERPRPGGNYYNRQEPPRIVDRIETVKNTMLFLDVARQYPNLKEGENIFTKVINDPYFWPTYLKFRTTHSFRLNIGQCNIGDDPCNTIRAAILKHCQEYPTKGGWGYTADPGLTDEARHKSITRQHACQNYQALTVRPTGRQKPNLPALMDFAPGQQINNLQ